MGYDHEPEIWDTTIGGQDDGRPCALKATLGRAHDPDDVGCLHRFDGHELFPGSSLGARMRTHRVACRPGTHLSYVPLLHLPRMRKAYQLSLSLERERDRDRLHGVRPGGEDSSASTRRVRAPSGQQDRARHPSEHPGGCPPPSAQEEGDATKTPTHSTRGPANTYLPVHLRRDRRAQSRSSRLPTLDRALTTTVLGRVASIQPAPPARSPPLRPSRRRLLIASGRRARWWRCA